MKNYQLLTLLTLLATTLAYPGYKRSAPSHRILTTSGDTTLPTSYQIINNFLTIYFNFETDSTITVALVCTIPNQYFAVGLGSAMADADVWYFEISGGTVNFVDSYTNSQNDPKIDTTNDLTILGYDIQATKTIVKFNRKLDTGSAEDHVLAQGDQDMIWATSSSNLIGDHTDSQRGAVILNLRNGATGYAEEGLLEAFEETHGILLVVAWAFLFDVSLVFARYNKALGRPPFQLLHSLFMWMTYILSTVSIAIMLDRWMSVGSEMELHGIIGVVILALSSLMMIGGVVTINGVKSDSPSVSGLATTGKSSHKYGGYLLYILTRLDIVLGCIDAGDTWIIVVVIWMSVVFVAHVVVSLIRRKKQFDYVPIYEPKAATEDQVALVQAISKGLSHEEITRQFGKKKWVIYGNYILDLTDWIHPGGNFIIEAVVGREVTQFLKGAFTLESSPKSLLPYTHSKAAYQVINKYIIGSLPPAQSALIDDKGSNGHSTFNQDWTLVGREPMTKSLTKFDFCCQQFSSRGLITDVTGFGRHFTIKFANREPARTYTTALSLTHENVELRNKVFEALMNDAKLNPAEFKAPKYVSLPLFIKKYDFPKGLSRALHDANLQNTENTKFKVEGPAGNKITFKEKAQGTYVFLCAGTGILPFLDLLNYVFYKTAFDILKQQGRGQEAEAILNLGFNFNYSIGELKFKLLGAFLNLEETYGWDLISKLAQVCRKFSKNIFEAALTSADKGDTSVEKITGRFDKNLLSQQLNVQSEAFYVCGPPGFNKTVPVELEKMGVAKSKIIYV